VQGTSVPSLHGQIQMSPDVQESTDRSFIKKHQGVAKAQANQWVESAEGIREAILELKSSTPDSVGAQPMDVTDDKRPLRKGEPSSVPRGERWENLESAVPAATRKLAPLAKSQVVVTDDGRGPGQSGLENGEFAGQVTMSEATQAALPGALKAIFLKHNVCRYCNRCLLIYLFCGLRYFRSPEFDWFFL
jgi:hypothetical protein